MISQSGKRTPGSTSQTPVMPLWCADEDDLCPHSWHQTTQSSTRMLAPMLGWQPPPVESSFRAQMGPHLISLWGTSLRMCSHTPPPSGFRSQTGSRPVKLLWRGSLIWDFFFNLLVSAGHLETFQSDGKLDLRLSGLVRLGLAWSGPVRSDLIWSGCDLHAPPPSSAQNKTATLLCDEEKAASV